MFYQLPPVGNPIQLSRSDPHETLLQVFGEAYQPHYYASGTAALSAAITAAIHLKAIDNPEIILPAYACPDLISAIVFAGAKPVLVDIETDRPWMDLEQLSTKICQQTVAIIAVNLFGISERLDQLRPFAEHAGALLIEDSAQAFPGSNEDCIWQGDLVVLSFGRGKPVSLLGGGAVLSTRNYSGNHELANLLPEGIHQPDGEMRKQITFWLKAKAYNWMINPRLYWLPQALPFLHLGETIYHPLTSVGDINQITLPLLPSNIKAYQAYLLDTQNQLAAIMAVSDPENCDIVDLPRACMLAKTRRLLRYPLLIEHEARDRLYTRLHKLGLGPSCMYPKALPGISGLESLFSNQGPFPAATSFAKRILTLPTHSLVSQADIDNMRLVIETYRAK